MKRLFGMVLMVLAIGFTSCSEEEVPEEQTTPPVGNTQDVCCSGCIIGQDECYWSSADRFTTEMMDWKAIKEAEGCSCNVVEL